MKKLTTILSALLLTLAVSAQDATPSRFNFSAMPVGPLTMDFFIGGSNPPSQYADAKDALTNPSGLIGVTGGQMGNATQTANFQQMCQIVDLSSYSGANAGKVFMLKGINTLINSNIGTTPTVAYAGYTNLNFYTDTYLQEAVRYRVKITFAVKANAPGNDGFVKFGITTLDGGDCTMGFLGETLVYNSADIDDLWVTVETDVKTNEAGPATRYIPFRIKMSTPAGVLNNASVFIKDIVVTKMTTGKELYEWTVTTAPFSIPTGLKSVAVEPLDLFVSNGAVNVSGLKVGQKVEVFSMVGTQVSAHTATSNSLSITLNKGQYILKSDGKVSKIVL